ncbi:unnamed protein product [Peniophora sp. CBMAI 1063]|nr:unnamed protein product [Peniophora sp. CBMAI 1063]
MSPKIDPSKVKIQPKRHHFYNALLFLLGTLFPPLAVAARFGIGSDFWLNLLLTICGYIPGHVHNFYIQNVRNNKTNRRTPKWAQRYGLVDTSTIERHKKRSEWAYRYNERNPHSTLEDQQVEDGQVAGSTSSISTDAPVRAHQTGGEFWNPDTEEQYYNPDPSNGGSSKRWHYPANFQDASMPEPVKKKKSSKKDRFARTEDAYSMNDDSSRRRKKKKRSSRPSAPEDTGSTYSRASTAEGPEAAEGAYGNSGARRPAASTNDDDIFRHEF